jgi:DNA polymerase-1
MAFVKDESSNKRVVILDFLHLAYKYAYGGATGLSSTIMVDGVPRRVDTTIPAYTIKYIHRASNFGFNPTIVCFDGMGSSRSRKAYFAKYNGIRSGAEPVGYKGARESQDSRFYEGVNITMNLLMQGGVCCLKADGYEADDLIKAAVDRAKIDYPHTPIDIITGDADLVPLVDDQVSVFLASRKMTWAESKEIERRNYVQLTPSNYQSYMEGLTNYKNLTVPYNTVLLSKLLRGDKSDEIPAYPKFTPTKYKNLINLLIEDGYDLSDICRYDNPISVISYRGTEEPIPEELIESTPKEQKMIKFKEPPCLTKLCNILSDYLDEDIIEHVRFIYNGINLNGAFTGLPDGFNRRPAVVTQKIDGYLASQLQQAVSVVQINLPFN